MDQGWTLQRSVFIPTFNVFSQSTPIELRGFPETLFFR
jgi:hypothetical protein